MTFSSSEISRLIYSQLKQVMMGYGSEKQSGLEKIRLSVCMLGHRYILTNTVARMEFAPSCSLFFYRAKALQLLLIFILSFCKGKNGFFLLCPHRIVLVNNYRRCGTIQSKKVLLTICKSCEKAQKEAVRKR